MVSMLTAREYYDYNFARENECVVILVEFLETVSISDLLLCKKINTDFRSNIIIFGKYEMTFVIER